MPVEALARVEIARTRYDDAFRMINEQIDNGPLQTEWYLERAEVLDAMGKTADAERARSDALAHANQALRRPDLHQPGCTRRGPSGSRGDAGCAP
ncbi:MAG: hypothetical protein JRJ58_09390 [Deltaproteobacteria bacterium]|nr:hypothetical protein [Deltaproteobacteria bacterium]